MNKFYIFVFASILTIFVTDSTAGPGMKENSLRKAEPRIVDGYEATPGAWPWMAALMYDYLGQERCECGGSLIAPKWVLTAAHCVEKLNENNQHDGYMNPADIRVIIGVHDLRNDPGERIKVTRIFPHPSYVSKSVPDVALLELEKEVPQNTVPIYRGEESLAGKEGTVLGWGVTSPDGTTSTEKLQQVELLIISNETCNHAYNQVGLGITGYEICAGIVGGGKDSCQGDSGGPMVVWDNGVRKLAGIVAWGQKCGDPELYGVYTRVSSVVGFIDKHLKPSASVIFSDDDGGCFIGVTSEMKSCFFALILVSVAVLVFAGYKKRPGRW